MRYLTLAEIIELHHHLIQQAGGSPGIRDVGGLESAIAQPRMIFNGEELYLTIIEKAVALGFSLIQNHPFVDGNKRVGHAAMEIFLILNGTGIEATIDEQEEVILKVASGNLGRKEFEEWLRLHLKKN
ncbi:MAG: type II toxin-antitoxin system death-on-curing family toxin [Anaerolineae bacterium]|jgi:death on curing protein|nr:type II toxin-antitoxin system death-on-curing family toxin [Anaerolineae bacterium]MBT7191665.1 type II toxin-antitoxin system death-on-curing family toxin [Anaerolineae bacterium]MBT7991779.1 type II toxin-antitoxin system death-on-curing family toxin [Anaerolineae bacterium]